MSRLFSDGAVVFTKSRKLLNLAGLLELVVNRFRSRVVNSELFSSTTDRICFHDEIYQSLPSLVAHIIIGLFAASALRGGGTCCFAGLFSFHYDLRFI